LISTGNSDHYFRLQIKEKPDFCTVLSMKALNPTWNTDAQSHKDEVRSIIWCKKFRLLKTPW